jgi:hypothetical protein
LIEQLAARLRIDTVRAADLLVYLCNVVSAAVIDFNAEQHFDYLQRAIALGHLDRYAPRNLPPRR